MSKQATGSPTTKKAANATPSGARKGMAVGPKRPTAKITSVAKPVIAKDPIAGVKTDPKKQPMYTGKSSSPGKMVDQYGYGIAKTNGAGYQDSAAARTKYNPAKHNSG